MFMSTLKTFPKKLLLMNQTYCREVPSLTKTHHFINDFINFLFPIRTEKNISLLQIEAKWEDLQRQFMELITPLQPLLEKPVSSIANEFFGLVPYTMKK